MLTAMVHLIRQGAARGNLNIASKAISIMAEDEDWVNSKLQVPTASTCTYDLTLEESVLPSP